LRVATKNVLKILPISFKSVSYESKRFAFCIILNLTNRISTFKEFIAFEAAFEKKYYKEQRDKAACVSRSNASTIGNRE
jgi:hypothetical protein